MAGSDWLLYDAMREARRENLTYGLRHIAFNPNEPMTDAQLEEFARRICHEFHGDPEHMTLVIHQKDGSTHGHLLLPEWQQGHILDNRFSWIRLEKLARLEEIRLGHALVAGRHDCSIAKALRKEGRHQEAVLIDALVPEHPTDKPRAAYTSQSHRTAERQGLDLPQLKQLVCSLWTQSDGLKSFRAALTEHGLTMREGDRADKRSGAHIIEDQDGKLIGSFTRLTKVRMTEFRKLLAEEQHPTVSKPETDIKSTRLSIRRTTADFYEEYPIPKGPDTQTVLRKRPVIKRPQMRKWQRELWLQRMANVDTTTTEPLSPTSSIRIISAGEARFHKEITKAIVQQQAILDQQAPEASWKPLDRNRTITTWRRQLIPYQKQLRKSYDRYATAKRAWQEAEKSRWQRMTGRAGKLEKVYQQLLLKFLDVLRFVVQALLHIVGLRSSPPEPVRHVLTERDRSALEGFHKQYDAEFTAMADPDKLEPWLAGRFNRLVQARADRIRRWDRERQAEKERARQEIARLRAKLASPISTSRTQASAPSSRIHAPDLE
ncbi:hypothetical protein [Acetobacter vaccinii]|uniref:Relaxase/mobilization nuclease domain-containing protein n=1 Tax=Acetobacter vaccinii TaxID=2592655 RepID=A0A5C1YSL9_9PROT|nr:hypothetical protein [Acetobacter vaccinii]QEO18229.1 hypothetical protein FLP30_11285 [Acetobacter vaccinii]